MAEGGSGEFERWIRSIRSMGCSRSLRGDPAYFRGAQFVLLFVFLLVKWRTPTERADTPPRASQTHDRR